MKRTILPAPWRALVGVVALSALSSAALAQPPDQEPDGEDWEVGLGAMAQIEPDYEGSDDYEFVALPFLMVNYRDLVFLEGLTLGANAFTWQGPRPEDKLQVGPLVRYEFGRDDSDDLRGMGDVDDAVELGAFISYGSGPWSTGFTVFRDVSDSHDGLTAELSAGHMLSLGPKLMLSSEISATWADDNYMETFFGVTAAQSARSGMRQYQAESGFNDVGISFDLNYDLTDNWGLTGQVGYKRLLGDAADSPLVEDRGSANQFTAALYVSYEF